MHEKHPISFTLWVDDFGIKYIDKAHVEELLTLLGLHYKMKVDWNGTFYLGITLAWNYTARTVDLSMPGYVQRALT